MHSKGKIISALDPIFFDGYIQVTSYWFSLNSSITKCAGLNSWAFKPGKRIERKNKALDFLSINIQNLDQ
jgi:hypothetical protein